MSRLLREGKLQLDTCYRGINQLRGYALNETSYICSCLYNIGPTSVMSDMDNFRKLVGSPLADTDLQQIIDTHEVCNDTNDISTDSTSSVAGWSCQMSRASSTYALFPTLNCVPRLIHPPSHDIIRPLHRTININNTMPPTTTVVNH